MAEIIEAVFDGTVFRPQGEVELKPNTRVEIMITVKTALENPKPFRVRSKHLGFRKDLNCDKTSALVEGVDR